MLEVLAFGGGVNWPLWIAIERGFLERRGVAVNLRYTPNSVESMQALAAGRIDIAMASIDNLIAYMEGQGEAPLLAPPQFFAFLGNQRGLLRVVARPEIKTWADLRAAGGGRRTDHRLRLRALPHDGDEPASPAPT